MKETIKETGFVDRNGKLHASSLYGVSGPLRSNCPEMFVTRRDLLEIEDIVREMEDVTVDKKGEMSATYGDILGWAYSLRNLFFPVVDDETVYPSEVFNENLHDDRDL